MIHTIICLTKWHMRVIVGLGLFTGSREARAVPCSAPSSPTSPNEGPQLARQAHRGSKCNRLAVVIVSLHVETKPFSLVVDSLLARTVYWCLCL